MIVVYIFAGIGALAVLAALIIGCYAGLLVWQMRRAVRYRSRDWQRFH